MILKVGMAKNRDNFSVIPAHAGVILVFDIISGYIKGNTRTRGGDPHLALWHIYRL